MNQRQVTSDQRRGFEQMKVLLVDDEAPARQRLGRMLRQVEDLEIVGEADDGLAAIEAIEEKQPDLVFLDVEMPGCNGIEVARSLNLDEPPAIVFCTAYDRYAVEAFEVHAIDYLLKPVKKDRLKDALERVRTRRAKPSAYRSALAEATQQIQQREVPIHRFLARRGKKIFLLQESDVLAFKAEQGMTYAVTADSRYWINSTLSELESQLDDRVFFRIHRQTIVNLNEVREIAPLFQGVYQLILKSGLELEVSRRQASELFRKMGK